MLPSPFYTEVPADLGDDLTWAAAPAGGHWMHEPTHRLRTGLRAIVDDWVTPGALMLVCRMRKALAP